WERLPTLRVDMESIKKIAKRAWREDAEISTLDDGKVRRILAILFRKYILNERLYDAMSVPWGLLERLLTPIGARTRIEISENEQGGLAEAGLRFCRNKRVHASSMAEDAAVDLDDHFRYSVVLEFLVLLDFLEARKSPHIVGMNMWNAVSLKLQH